MYELELEPEVTECWLGDREIDRLERECSEGCIGDCRKVRWGDEEFDLDVG